MRKIKAAATKFQSNMLMRMAGVNPTTEKGSELIQVLGLILVAIILIVIFRDNLKDIFEKVTADVLSSLEALFGSKNGI